MSQQLVLTMSDELLLRVQNYARSAAQPIEQVLLAQLERFAPDWLQLATEHQNELYALQFLSDDALWTIAGEQMPAEAQAQLETLLAAATLTLQQVQERDALVDRADRLMLRKAEAALVLQQRGYVVSQEAMQTGL